MYLKIEVVAVTSGYKKKTKDWYVPYSFKFSLILTPRCLDEPSGFHIDVVLGVFHITFNSKQSNINSCQFLTNILKSSKKCYCNK